MDVYFMIRCKKVTMLLDTKETSQVLELKKMIEGILKVSPENQQLVKDETEVLLDNRTLADWRPQCQHGQSPAARSARPRHPRQSRRALPAAGHRAVHLAARAARRDEGSGLERRRPGHVDPGVLSCQPAPNLRLGGKGLILGEGAS
ncbi:hypothetical protein BOX15_Mlig009225g3 [Macrostomum lignano]|uniref:Ubiquitin-like domain-containing protein n=1 Tax=Macrostomum lignano TaxID=282301 RepID=A0A267DEB7_9PLAT|nr:hypothetical protein BOX15_Mlig009225g3 [Macrostomum lignano]